jgi:DNA-binding SARP family transcriptional activator
VEFEVLGPIEVKKGNTRISVGSGRERFVLATLLLNADRLTKTDHLLDALWTNPPVSAKAQLHNMISNLRRRLAGAGEIIATRPLGYELHLNGHGLDLVEFRRLVDQGRAATDPAQAASTLGDALALWRGAALANVPDTLARSVREALEEERLAAAECWLVACIDVGHNGEALRELARLLDEHPYRERLYEIQLTALEAAGRRADALAAYQRAYRRLVDDLGVEPGPALRDLEQRILRGEQVAPAGTQAGPRPRQLPPALTTITGRGLLLGELREKLRGSGGPSPVVALVGPGGIGKSALAITAGHEAGDAFPDGQLYADLRGSQAEPVRPQAVLGRFLRALGVDGAKIPADHDERTALYRSVLADRRILIVLDDAAGERQLRPLLPGAPGCATVVTSRHHLGGLIGVSRWTVPELTASDAVELLGRISVRDLAGDDRDHAAALVDLCGRLPLAVCVAGARLALSPRWTLVEYRRRLAVERSRLDELTIGDLDVRASIGLSYQALEHLPRKLFRRLGLLTGADWPSWVATELLEEPADQLLDQLASVHLVVPLGTDAVGQDRFGLHDLIADFARERVLAEEGEPARHEAVARMADGWLALASEADTRLGTSAPAVVGLAVPDAPRIPTRPAEQTPREWFEIERAGLGRTVAQLARHGMGDLAGRLALRMCRFLATCAYDDDRERVLSAAIDSLGPAGSDELRVRLLEALCSVHLQRSAYAAVPVIVEEQLAVARRLGSRHWQLCALSHAGFAYRRLGRLADAAAHVAQALTAAGAEASGAIRARLHLSLALIRRDLGEPALAVAAIEQALALQRACGGSRMIAILSTVHGGTLAECGRLDEAQTALAEARRLAVEIGDELGVATVDRELADLDIHRGDWGPAESRLAASLAYHGERRTSDLADALRSYGELAAAVHDMPAAAERLRRSLSVWRELGVPLETARVLSRLELVAAAVGDQAAATEAGAEWRAILADLGLTERSLRLPRLWAT